MDMRRILQWFKEELSKLLAAALFFAVAFCLIVLANKLMVSGSDVQVTGFVRAIVGGLIVAKILLIVDLLPFVDAFPGKPLVYNILWKTSIYVAASLLFRYVEPLIEFRFEAASWAAAHHHAVEAFRHPAFWAIEIWVALLLAIFVTMQGFSRAVGKDKVRLIFFGR